MKINNEWKKAEVDEWELRGGRIKLKVKTKIKEKFWKEIKAQDTH